MSMSLKEQQKAIQKLERSIQKQMREQGLGVRTILTPSAARYIRKRHAERSRPKTNA